MSSERNGSVSAVDDLPARTSGRSVQSRLKVRVSEVGEKKAALDSLERRTKRRAIHPVLSQALKLGSWPSF